MIFNFLRCKYVRALKVAKLEYSDHIQEITLKLYLKRTSSTYNNPYYCFKHDCLFRSRMAAVRASTQLSASNKGIFYIYQFSSILYRWFLLPFSSFRLISPVLTNIKSPFSVNQGIPRLTPPSCTNHNPIPIEHVQYRPSLMDIFQIAYLAFSCNSFTEPIYHIYYVYLSRLSSQLPNHYIYEDSGGVFQKAFIQVCLASNISVHGYISCPIFNLSDAIFELSSGAHLYTNQVDVVNLFIDHNLPSPEYVSYASSTFSGSTLDLCDVSSDFYVLIFPHCFDDINVYRYVFDFATDFFNNSSVPILISVHPQCIHLTSTILKFSRNYKNHEWLNRPSSLTDHMLIGKSLLIVGAESSLISLASKYHKDYVHIPPLHS